ncbi:hypothetical protein CLV35_2078 [Motilibacter peucedani]|uniref:Flagellar biosynthesis protein FlhF n=1 Tax=Motilibacter peucedani TaxID=598650 RepID=A0A420XQV0_9ACTN|nr:hypothetical protein [Motilibacter peucedani]RKS75604.1 hypothetical protein CLV35_2078 [Motilibacter peucedani]
MSTRLLLEGPTIEGVLAQVRAEHGDAARIVQADKVRSGGFAGFFAKEKFEVAVEIDDDAAPAQGRDAHVRRAAAALDILELVDDADDDEGGLAALGFTYGPSGAVTAPAPAVTPAVQAATEALAELREVRAAASGPRRPALAPDDDSPMVSTSSQSFARVLAALSRDIEEPEAPAFTPAPFAAPVVEAAVEPVVVEPVALQPAPVAAPAPASPAPAAATPTLDAETIAMRMRAGFEAVVAEAAAAAEDAPVSLRQSPAAVALLAAGVPESLLEGLPLNAGLSQAARYVADRLPAAAPCATGPGAVVAIVGEGRGAYTMARLLAVGLGAHADSVLLLADQDLGLRVPDTERLATRRQAARAIAARRELDSPVVLAVDAGVGRASMERALDMLEALPVDTAWLLVDATRKLGAVASDSLSAVDAVVLQNAAETASPAEVLRLDLPVAMVDLEGASPAVWTRVLVSAVNAGEDEEQG